MKKIISIALLCAMVLTCFAGCGMQKGELYVADEAIAQNIAESVQVGISDELQESIDNVGHFADSDVDVWNGATVETAWVETAQDNTYEITTAAELVGFRTLMATKDFTGWTIKLGKNIDLGGATLTGITANFKGTFDGQNHVIYNFDLKCSVADSGFFGAVNSGTVKNFALADVEVVASSTSNGSVAGIVNYAGSMINVFSDAIITVDAEGAIEQLGGLFGRATAGSTKNILNCEFAGVIDLSDRTVVDESIGGIMGYWNKGTLVMTGCVNNGVINAPNAKYVGGLLGNVSNAPGAGTYTSCENNGAVYGGQYVAGFIGNIGLGATSVTNGRQIFTDCVNTGTIDGLNYVGGFIGRARMYGAKSTTNSSGQPAISVDLTNCVSSATMTACGIAGGLIGGVHAQNVDLTNCTFSGELIVCLKESGGAVGGLIGKLYWDLGMVAGADPKASFTECEVSGYISVDKYAVGCYVDEFVGTTALEENKISESENSFTGFMDDVLFSSMVGYQTSEVYQNEAAEDKYDLRFVAAFDDANAIAAGFKASVYYKNEEGKQVKIEDATIYVKTVYKSINGGEKTYTAGAYGADYLYTLVIKGIDAAYTIADRTLEVVITPFTAADAETINVGSQVQFGAIVAD